MNTKKVNQAIILAAGRGQRLMPYTKDTPKPLMKIGSKTLLERQLEELKSSGIDYVTIHTSYLANKIKDYIGDGSRFNLEINYAHSDSLLGAGGGIIFSKDFLKYPDETFLLFNGDVYTDFNIYNFLNLSKEEFSFPIKLVLIDNPEHNLKGDFCFNLNTNLISAKKDLDINSNLEKNLTYSGISLIDPIIFNRNNINEIESFLILIEPYLINNQIIGDYYNGVWYDIGSPERYEFVNKIILDK